MSLKKLFGRSQKKRLDPPDTIFNEYPAGLRMFLIEDLVRKMLDRGGGEPLPYSREADRIGGVLFQQNAAGMEFEKAGKVDDAITLYERSVADWFDGSHPYDRLRIIYAREKRYDDAIRVCRAFVRMAETLMELGSPRSDLGPKREQFLAWIDKLEAKK